MTQFSLMDLLHDSGNRMSVDLKQRMISHPGEIGKDREAVIRQFLGSYLPKRFEISTGFVFDSAGRVSRQLDIVIAHAHACARFETVGGTRYYPCESVVGVGQVRSSLTSRRDLSDALENLESVKALDRSANGKAFDDVYREVIDHTNNYLHQIFTFLLVTGKVLAGDTVREELLQHTQMHSPHLWPNVILALEQFLVTYCCLDGVCPNTMHARGITLQLTEDKPGLLMRFFLLLGGAIEVTRVSGLPYWQYLGDANRWNGDVWHSTLGDPPPLLSATTIPVHKDGE